MSATIVQSGDYDLFIDTGFPVNAFTLDSATKGILDDTNYVLDGSTSYASVIGSSTNISVFRGRRDIGDQGIVAGTMQFDLLDTSGIFNPFAGPDSPYYDPENNQPGLAPLRKVILTREGEELFNGVIVNYSYSFTLGQLDRVNVFCADPFYVLSQTYLDEWNVDEELSSERFANMLDLPEVNFPALERNIQTGVATLGGSSAFTVENGTSVADYASQIQTSEYGRIFVGRDGWMNFQRRIGSTLGNPIAEFHQDGAPGTLPFDAVGISFDADFVVNRASVTIAGSNNPQIAEDLASQTQYLIQTTSITGSLLHNDPAALTLAEYLLEPQPEARFTELSVSFVSLTAGQRDQIAVAEIGDVINIQKTIIVNGTETEFAQDLAIEGIGHEINVSSGHRMTFYTSPTTIVYELILDDPVYGTLDGENVLG